MSQLRHSLRTPLNHVIGCAELLLEDTADPEIAAGLERILGLARAASEAISPVGNRSGNDPESEQTRETLILKARAIESEATGLDVPDSRNVERIRGAASEILSLLSTAGALQFKAESALPRFHVRGDSQPFEGRLLVVDDEEINRDLLRRHLRKQGYQAETAPDGATALQLLRTHSFDAVLLDLAMPGMDGWQVLHAIRSDAELRQIPVLMILAADDLHAIADSIQRGAEDYLFKPFDTILLDARLRATLERKRFRDHERSHGIELERVTQALQRSNEDLQRFAYAASHDLQAPVRTITTYLQLLQRRVGGKLTADELEMIGFAQGAAKRMHNLIQDLLCYSRVTTAQISREDVNCQELLESLLVDMQVTLEETGARVTFNDLPVMVSDSTSLRQLLQNLLGNAVKYRRPEESPRIAVKVVCEDGHWIFSVRDNGQGIPPEYSKQIFLMFKRLHGDEVPGSGIGLAICHRIVERFGGRIWVDSEPGHGSIFYFTVPCVDAAIA